jgi:hypothetical protein
MTLFFHDVPADVVAEAFKRGERKQSGTPTEEAMAAARVAETFPTRFHLCRADRFFPAEFMRRVVKERLGITPDEMVWRDTFRALAHPNKLEFAHLERYRLGAETSQRF